MASVSELPEIEPLHERWEPNPDPSSIVVPGVDSSATVQDQLDQIEQLITIKLQNIDENFSQVAEILATQILPAVRRFGVNTEPIRQAAKFWVSFFEQAAKIRIPTSDDFSYDASTQDQEQSSHHDSSDTSSRTITFDPNVTPSDNSFMPGQAAISSTPFAGSSRAKASGNEGFAVIPEEDSTASWAASIESPLDRLDREMQGLILQNDSTTDASSATPAFSSMHASYTTGDQRPPVQFTADPQKRQQQQQTKEAQDAPSSIKGKERAPPSLREFLLRQNLQTASSSSSQSQSTTKSSHTSPLKIKPKTPKRNPYIPANVQPRDWDGIVDLTKPATRQKNDNTNDWDSDSDDDMPPGMSPPVTISFGGMAGVTRSPAKVAAARIGSDLVSDIEHRRRAGLVLQETDTSQSTVPTPPSLSRYIHDTSESSMDQNAGLHEPVYFNTEDPMDDDSLDDSFDEGNTNMPAGPFFLASRLSNDSFNGSNQSSDSPSPDEGDFGGQAVHPFARALQEQGGDDMDDSFEDSLDYEDQGTEEPTVFGPAHRNVVAPSEGEGQLKLLGQDLFEETIGIGRRLARAGIIEGTPTPFYTNKG